MPHVDLHLHLLPGVDDGPADEVASLEHAARLARDRVHEATVTPHVLASDGHGGARTHTLAGGPPAARAAGASRLGSNQLTAANPRFLLQNGIASTPVRRETIAWRSPHERRVRRALAAARPGR